jgi:hypothetical protein
MSVDGIPEHRQAWQCFAAELPDFGDRNKVPSVSQVLAWKYGGPPDLPQVHIAMDRGTKIHQALEFFDEGDLHFESIRGSEIESYLETWKQWCRPDDEWLGIETPLFGVLCDVPYLVKPDRVLKRRGQVWIIDVKTKSKVGRPPNDDERLKHGLAAAAQTVAVQQRMAYVAVNWQGCAYIWPSKIELVGYNDPRLIDKFAEILCEWKSAQAGEAAVA